MRICHFFGTEVDTSFCMSLSTGLYEHGVAVDLITLGVGSAPEWLPPDGRITFSALNARRRTSYLRAAWKLAHILKDRKVDILQTHLYFGGLVGVLTKFFGFRKPVVLMRHHSGVVHLLGSRFHIEVDKWMANRADVVVAPSQGTADFIKDVDHIKTETKVIYYGFDFSGLTHSPEEGQAIRAEFGISSTDFVVGYVGNFISGKGHIQLLRAFLEISRAIPNAKLMLVGRGELEEVNSFIKSHGLEEKVILTGFRKDVAKCLSAMDVFVQPSLSEAFSQVLIEAMAVGLPVVATRVGGAAEVVEDGVNGYLVEPDDPPAIADAVIKYYSNSGRRTSMAQLGCERVRRDFTAKRMVDEHLALYRELLKRGD